MKRSVILSLFAVTLTALCATTAQADVNAQLNLFYTDPAIAGDPNFGCIHNQSCAPVGGTWQLLVQSHATNGIAGIRFVIDGISGVDGLNNGDITGNDQVWTDPNDPSVFNFNFVAPTDPNNGSVEIVAGDDLNGPLILFVGTGSGTPGNRVTDDLRSSFWDNSALIASGSFDGHFHDIIAGGTVPLRPTLISVEANEFGADPNIITAATIGTMSTRGDAADFLGLEVAGTGLYRGDADRDGDTTIGDFVVLQTNFPRDPNQPHPSDPNGPDIGAFGWNDADFDNDGDVNIGDFVFLQSSFPLAPKSPPPISALSAVPEPSTVAMLCVAGLAVVSRRRRTFRDPFYRRIVPPCWGGDKKHFWRGKNLPESS